MSHNRPIKVFTEVKNAPLMKYKFREASDNKTNAQLIEDNMNICSQDRYIDVTGVGDIVLSPDRFSIAIKCNTAKDTLQDAKNSVTRRLDYICQTFKNYGLKEEDYQVYQHINHIDSMVHIDCEVEAHFTDFSKCQSVSNLLVEKLGPAISVTLPRCYHAKGSLDKSRKQASMLAIHNARQKAGEMARVVHLAVGHAVKVEELGTTESYGAGEKDEDLDLSPGMYQRLNDATVNVSSRVSVCFELKSSKGKKKSNFQ